MEIIILAYSVPILCFLSFCLGGKAVKEIYCKNNITTEQELLIKNEKNWARNYSDKGEKNVRNEEKMRIFAENIENFGTTIPQKDVKGG